MRKPARDELVKRIKTLERQIAAGSARVQSIKPEYSFDPAKTISFLVSRLNTGYDYFGVLFLGLIKILAIIGRPLKKTANKWQIERDYFCSELCYEAFHKGGGLDIVPLVPQADITSPGDIAKSSVVERVG